MQFTVYRNRDPASRARVPLLLDVQSELVGQMATCVVVPLITPERAQIAAERLMPTLEVEGQRWVMETPLLAGIPRKALGKQVADVSSQRDVVLAALDMLISGV